MAKRHSDALGIQQGAVNPSGMAHSLVAACKECLDEGVTQREDPAVQLIVHQLAFIVGVSDGVSTGPKFDYHAAMRACEEAVERDRKVADLTKFATSEQMAALHKVFEREWETKPQSFNEFLVTVQISATGDCLMVPFAGMWLGVEKDGYTHS